jgi:hypothetical protein
MKEGTTPGVWDGGFGEVQFQALEAAGDLFGDLLEQCLEFASRLNGGYTLRDGLAGGG